jgi:predicted O-methyltransferase YrrM
MAQMGHGQTPEDHNLGLGWVYYGLARALTPAKAVVIGSMRGFVPLVIGKAMQDNGSGEVVFVDPSLVDDFWTKPAQVAAHFASHDVHNVRHFRNTTQEFVLTEDYRTLDGVGLLFIDGYHSQEQARFDHESFASKLVDGGVVLFHDSVRERVTRIYGEERAYTHTVNRYMDDLRADSSYEVLSLPVSDGVTIVRRTCG